MPMTRRQLLFSLAGAGLVLPLHQYISGETPHLTVQGLEDLITESAKNDWGQVDFKFLPAENMEVWVGRNWWGS